MFSFRTFFGGIVFNNRRILKKGIVIEFHIFFEFSTAIKDFGLVSKMFEVLPITAILVLAFKHGS
jgi:hypothetical protein